MWETMRKRWAVICSIATAVVGLLGFAVTFGYEPEAPIVWRYEFEAAEKIRKEHETILAGGQILRKERQIYNNDFQIRRYKEKGRRVPGYLLRDKSLLKRELENLKLIERRNKNGK